MPACFCASSSWEMHEISRKRRTSERKTWQKKRKKRKIGTDEIATVIDCTQRTPSTGIAPSNRPHDGSSSK